MAHGDAGDHALKLGLTLIESAIAVMPMDRDYSTSDSFDSFIQQTLPFPEAKCPVCKEPGTPVWQDPPIDFEKETKDGRILKRKFTCPKGHGVWVPLNLQENIFLTYIVASNARENCNVCDCEICKKMMREAPFKGVKHYTPVFITCGKHK